MSAPYILVWTARAGNQTRDKYRVYEDSGEAMRHYRLLLEREDTYAAHIARPTHSTDYETVGADELVAALEQIGNAALSLDVAREIARAALAKVGAA